MSKLKRESVVKKKKKLLATCPKCKENFVCLLAQHDAEQD